MAKKSPSLPLSSAVIPAAGLSRRMGGKVRKPYLELRKRPVLSWTLEAIGKVPNLQEIVLVIRPEDTQRAEEIIRKSKLPRRVKTKLAPGGARRQDSVSSGIHVTHKTSKVILIHDAARPFPALSSMKKAVLAANKTGASLLAVPVRDTVKQMKSGAKGKGRVQKTIPRELLWLAQTPQVLKRTQALDLFKKLYAWERRNKRELEFTDDAALCEHFKKSVELIESSAVNFKITNPEDIKLAEAYIKAGLVGA